MLFGAHNYHYHHHHGQRRSPPYFNAATYSHDHFSDALLHSKRSTLSLAVVLLRRPPAPVVSPSGKLPLVAPPPTVPRRPDTAGAASFSSFVSAAAAISTSYSKSVSSSMSTLPLRSGSARRSNSRRCVLERTRPISFRPLISRHRCRHR